MGTTARTIFTRTIPMSEGRKQRGNTGRVVVRAGALVTCLTCMLEPVAAQGARRRGRCSVNSPGGLDRRPSALCVM